ncbi:uncharacterized protein LOC120445421 isoform X1 [Drosophila santomea]|uniref:uncharacterized protein LOC120445421 isoform X1 n=1 Tax=Drosophila santomea TaxID=129105 RepID=UPI00195416D5|nr:uncharacterized protein LOC120445421 isoform X1 [Drosophila santomea]
MSSPLVLLTALLLASSTICQALPDLHKQMTPDQLQSVFHVDTHDAVPHYELVQLHHHENNHNRRRRSIGEGPKVNAALPPHHVKKDLSKNAYYSELKHEAMASGGNHLFAPEVSAIKSHNVSFSAFGQHLNLSLRATQGLFKGAPHQLRMWTVGSEPNATHGLDLQEIVHQQHNSNDVGEVFQDEKNMAAILMRRHMETGDLIMEGSIGHDLVIKPLPHELSPNPEESHHIIYKREASAAEDQLSDFAFMEPDDLLASEKLERLQRRQRRSRRSAPSSPDFEDLNDEDEGALDAEPQVAESRTRSRRQAPYIIYPEVLVIVDYDGYRLHGGDNLQVKRYFISFWNGVDLRYRLLKGPRIRISIAGIIISRGRDATPYLERNRVGRDAIDSAAALTDMGKYLFRERRLPVYDIAVAITKLDMCRRTSAYGECNRGTAGFAYVGGACVVNKRLEKVNSVAIIEDTGGFSGIIVAAHEVGHLLGAVHDGSPPPSYLGGPGAQRCRWEDGYIMSDLRHTERGFRWSACTVQSFHHFLNGDTATCLHNAPHEDSALGRSLPGTLLSLDAQCRRDRGTYACFKDERVCAQLFCFDAQTGYCVAYRPAAEGSACGNGYHCLDGRCTPLPSNIIPDYGHNYRLVYNKIDNKKDATEDIESSSEETESQEDETESVEDQDEGNTSSEEQEDNQVEQSSAAGAAAVQSTTTARTTTTTTVRTTSSTSTAKPKSKSFGYLHRSLPERQWVQDNGVLVTTRISSSVSSSSSSSTNTNADSAATSTRRPTTTRTTTQTPNLFQIYTHELRKQIEYYLHMLQTQQHATKLQPEQQQQQSQQQQSIVEIPLVQKRLTNYSVTSSSSSSTNSNSNSNGAKPQAPSNKDENQRQQQVQQQLQDGLPDEENEATAGIQSNEAIERQKRKFPTTPTAATSAAQKSATPATPATPATSATSAKPTPSNAKPITTSSFLDAYFKKLQALHDGGSASSSSTATSVSSSVSSATSSKQQQHSQQVQQQQQQAQQLAQQADGSHFLKRTPHRSSLKAYKTSSSSSNNSSSQSQQQQQQQQYATNYIGDTTNNLPAVLDNSSSASSTTESAKKPKIKTQKLIRRTRVM